MGGREEGREAGREIQVVEPHVPSLAHSPFNAALLHTVCLAFPDRSVSFTAMPEHLGAVRGILSERAPQIEARVAWREIPPPSADDLRTRWRWSGRVLREFLNGGLVLFASLSRIQLLQAKLQMRLRPGARACVVLHGELDELLSPRPEAFPMRLMSLPNVLRMKNPRGLRYIILGRSILENVPAGFGELVDHAGVIDHPYHFPEARPRAANGVTFGVFGNSGAGRELEEVAKRVKAARPSTAFRLVGYVESQEAVDRLSPYVEGVQAGALPRAEYERIGGGVTYALWLCQPGGFKLRASGTFFDALAFATPLVYTENPFVDTYREQAPEIGWACRDFAEIAREIVRRIDEFDPSDHDRQRQTILRFRERFLPENQVGALREALGWPES